MRQSKAVICISVQVDFSCVKKVKEVFHCHEVEIFDVEDFAGIFRAVHSLSIRRSCFWLGLKYVVCADCFPWKAGLLADRAAFIAKFGHLFFATCQAHLSFFRSWLASGGEGVRLFLGIRITRTCPPAFLGRTIPSWTKHYTINAFQE